MILRLAHSQPRDIAVPAAPLVLGILLNELTPPQVRAVERDLKLVILAFTLELPRYINPLGDEHVVRLEHNITVDLDGGERVEAVKRDHGLGAGGNAGRGEGGAVGPGALADPLDVELVLADERVGNEAMVHEVEVDVGRELGDG